LPLLRETGRRKGIKGGDIMGIRFLNREEAKHVQDRINSDPEFRIAARFMSQDILIGVGDAQCIIRAREGVITGIAYDPSPIDKWNFFIRAPENGWNLFLKPIPPPFYQGFFTAAMREDFQFGGDVEALFAHYWAVQRMLAVMRELQNE
jgi:hypothetical protein